MSRSTMYVRFPDGSLRYGLFNNTGFVAWPKLYDSADAAWDAYDDTGWEDFEEGSGEPVDITTEFGSWSATATREYVTSVHAAFDLGLMTLGPLADWALVGLSPNTEEGEKP